MPDSRQYGTGGTIGGSPQLIHLFIERYRLSQDTWQSVLAEGHFVESYYPAIGNALSHSNNSERSPGYQSLHRVYQGFEWAPIQSHGE
ncbi:MAG: hypothetical protein Q9168_004593 [Polycauliona sp. 1 TL-2023]